MRRLAGFVIGVLLSLGSTADLGAQAGAIRGRVSDSAGVAVARAAITVDGLRLRTTSDEQGSYAITGVPAGEWTVRVRRVGYVPASARVTVRGAVVDQPFALTAQPISLSAIDVTVGSRALHTAVEELAVPVDVFTAEVIERQGTRETGQILQALAPSVNFPHQSVTDATDVARPFTLRGLSPDHTLVLLNGWRRHQTAVVNTFAYGTNAGSSGVDLNTIPASAIERIEVLRDGASAQYGSDAIAGVVNIVTRDGAFAPFVSADVGGYVSGDFPSDGRFVNVDGGWGLALGRGSLTLFAEVLDREPTNRAYADAYENAVTGQTDSIGPNGDVITKRNPVPQPNHHWGDGLERDLMTLASLRLPLNDTRTREVFAFGGVSTRHGSGFGYRRCAADCGSFISGRNWSAIFPQGYLPEFRPDAADYSLAGGYRIATGGWSVELGAAFGQSAFEYHLRNTLNVSLGPCLTSVCSPGGIPNQTSFFAGRLSRGEMSAGIHAARRLELGLRSPASLAVGVAFRREQFSIERGDQASYINGGHLAEDSAGADGVFGDDPGTPAVDESADDNLQTRAGSQVFSGFSPADEVDASRTNFGAYADLEGELSGTLLGNVAARLERYSDFGSLVTGKLALRWQASPRLTVRAAGSTGFRAPGLGQIHFSHISTNVIAGQVTDVGIFPVGDSISRLLGSRRLHEETALNLSGGVAWSPAPNLTITADYYRIALTDRILLGATFDDDTTLAILAANGIDSIGGVQYFVNGLDTRTEGVDLTGTWRRPALGGSLDLTAAVNFTENTITRVDPLPAALANSDEPGIIDPVTYLAITKERPDWRGTLTADWSRGRLRALARASYYGGFSSAQPGYCDNCGDSYGAKTLFDAEFGYHFGRFDLAVGARNLLDSYPDRPSSTALVDPSDPSAGTATDYNSNSGIFPWAAASPFGYNGRFVYARVRAELTR